MDRRPLASWVVCAFLFGQSALAAGSPYSYTTRAETGDRFPAFGRSVSINCSGDVAFSAVSVPSLRAGAYVARGAEIYAVHEGAATPDAYSDLTINDSGMVAFTIQPDSSGNRVAMFADGQGVTPIGDGPRQGAGDPALNNLGQLAYRGSHGASGIFIRDRHRVTAVAEFGKTIHGTFGNRVSINDRGEVAFAGTLIDGTRAIVVGNGFDLFVIAQATTKDQQFWEPVLNNAGTVVFRTQIAGRPALYSADRKTQSLIVDTSGPFLGLSNVVSINGRGGIAFKAWLKGAQGVHGIFTGPDPVADKVILVGDELAGSTVTGVEIGWSALNDRGQIAFQVGLANGKQAVVVATPAGAPEPTSACSHVESVRPILAAPTLHPYQELAASMPPSRWLQEERKRYAALLQKAGADALVAPFQASGHTLDATGRAMLARLLAAQLEEATGDRVADVGWVEKALGEPARNVALSEIFKLGQQLGVRRIVIGSVQHDRAYRMSVSLRVWDGAGGRVGMDSERRELAWENVEFSDTKLPYMAFRPLAVEAATAIGAGDFKPAGAQQGHAPQAGVPDSLAGLQQRATISPQDAALLLEFVGSLHPASLNTRSREQLFERALIVLERLAPSAPGYRLLQARALAALHRRPAAVAALGTPQTPAESALLAYLNADLPGLEAQLPAVQQPLLRLMAEFDLQDVRFAYDRPIDHERTGRLAEQYPAWAGFVVRRLLDGNPWGGHSHAWSKLALETLLPAQTQTLAEIVAGRDAEAAPVEELDIAQAIMSEVDAGFDELGKGAPASSAVATLVQPTDLLELALTVTLANAVASSQADVHARGLPRDGLDTLESYEAIFPDHPLLLQARVDALRYWMVNRRATARDRERSQDEWIRLTRAAIVWLGQQSDLTIAASDDPADMFPELAALSTDAQAQALFVYDYPQRVSRSGFRSRKPGDNRADAQHCTDYTLYQVNCVAWLTEILATRPEPDRAALAGLAAQFEHRFIGHPQRDEVAIRLRRAMGETVSTGDVLAQAVAAGTDNWEAYYSVGEGLIRQGKYAEARDVFLRYPGFSGEELVDRVKLGNRAYIAGSRLYWVGSPEEARPLYMFAAALDTGSDSNLTSAARLAMLEGDLSTAAEILLARARRYDSPHAYRDHIALLHLMGQSDTAWSLFDGLLGRGGGLQKWTGAAIGHRLSGLTEPQIAEWAGQAMRSRESDPRFNSAASRYVFMMNILDREPPQDFAALVRRLDPRLEKSNGILEIEEFDADIGRPIRPVVDHGVFVLAAQGIAAFYRGDMRTAYAALDQIGPTWKMQEFLPYYAYAAAVVGDTERIDTYLRQAPASYDVSTPDDPRNRRYYDHIAQAFLSGHGGEHEQALTHLRAAFHDRPFTEHQVLFTEYQLIEAAELLYEKTGKDAYRAFGFDVARRLQVVEPMFSWLYAFAAKLAPTTAERTPYLATAMYLDRHSWRVAQMSDEDRDAATAWLTANGPMSASKRQPAQRVAL